MFENKIIIEDIVFVDHLIGNDRSSFTVFQTKNMNHCQLLYKLEGEAEITFDDKTVVEKTDCIRFLPGNRGFDTPPYYSAKVIRKGECINIGFVSDSVLPNEIAVINTKTNVALKSLFLKLYKVWHSKSEGYYHESLSLIYKILYEITRETSYYKTNKTYMQILPAIDHIDNNFSKKDISCEYLAKLCGVSHAYLIKLFEAHLGLTPNKYITKKKLDLSCELIRTGQYTLSEVAEKAGFSNEYYFSKIFKKEMGVPPSKYEYYGF